MSPTDAATSGQGAPAFRAVYDAHFTYVWHTLRRLGVWDRELDDAAHDVFVVVHRKLGDYDPARPLKPWLAGIATRVASEFRRRARNRYEIVADSFERVDSRPDAEALVDAGQKRALVHTALDTLDAERREVFVLVELSGHSVADIARELDVSVNTMYSRLRLARRDFKAAVLAIQARDDASSAAQLATHAQGGPS